MKRETPAAAESAIAAREGRAGRGSLEAAVADWSPDLGAAHVLTAASGSCPSAPGFASSSPPLEGSILPTR